MKKQQQSNLFWGIFFLIIGALFLLNNLGVDIDIEEIFLTYWPLILIAVGLKNLWPHLQKKEDADNPVREESNR
jgi:lia operon protein LiaF